MLSIFYISFSRSAFFSTYSSSVMAPRFFKSNRSLICLITSERKCVFPVSVFPCIMQNNQYLWYINAMNIFCFDQFCTCSTATAGLFATFSAVSAAVSRLGRFVGFAENIGTSGILSLVAVPTI